MGSLVSMVSGHCLLIRMRLRLAMLCHSTRVRLGDWPFRADCELVRSQLSGHH
jgi:hypothetical protein